MRSKWIVLVATALLAAEARPAWAEDNVFNIKDPTPPSTGTIFDPTPNRTGGGPTTIAPVFSFIDPTPPRTGNIFNPTCPRTGCGPTTITPKELASTVAKMPDGVVSLDYFLEELNATGGHKKKTAPVTADNIGESLQRAQRELQNRRISVEKQDTFMGLLGSTVRISRERPQAQ